MKARHLFLALGALLAAGGLWLARSAWRAHRHLVSHTSSMGVGAKTPPGPIYNPNRAASLATAHQTAPAPGANNGPQPGQTLNAPARLAPPEPNRRFTDFTPEQRVQFARQGHGPGG